MSSAPQALLLDPQQVHDVVVGEVREVVLDSGAHVLDPSRHQRGRSHEGDLHAEQLEAHDVAARDPAVEDVAHDRDTQAVQVAAEGLPQGEEVLQALRGVLVAAVARIDDARLGVGGEHLAGARRWVTQHDDVGAVGRQSDGGVLEALRLLEGRSARLQGDGVGRETLGGQVEAGRGPRGGLPEEVDDSAAAQRRHLLDVALEDGQEALRGVEQQLDLLAAEVLHRDQIALGHGHTPSRRARTTSSTPSLSTSRTLMRSSSAVGRFLPT